MENEKYLSNIKRYRKPKLSEIKFYKEEGYIVVKDVVPINDIIVLKKYCDELISKKKKYNVKDWSWKTEDGNLDKRKFRIIQVTVSDKFEQIHNMSFRKWSTMFASKLHCRNVKFWYDQFIGKKPNYDASTPWHQDEAYWGPSLSNHVITWWTPLQDVDINNGCMHFLKNGHKLGVLKHENPTSIQSDQLICEINNADIIPCPINMGSVTFHNSKMPHMTTSNSSDQLRYAMTQHFHTESISIDSNLQYDWKVTGRRKNQV